MASLNYTVRLCQVKKERKEKRMGGREGKREKGKEKNRSGFTELRWPTSVRLEKGLRVCSPVSS